MIPTKVYSYIAKKLLKWYLLELADYMPQSEPTQQ